MSNYKTATFFQTKNFVWLKNKHQVLPMMAQVKFGTQGVCFARGFDQGQFLVRFSLFGLRVNWATKNFKGAVA